ncbi:glycosyltransferase involved in cell wall biosynthesis [Chitinophaga skermanii]|uniref:Glycosyltransferase involved in cell wall biosynthesis n=2 Tax=Chitinophaga skermanii TaxID=331697 RepID=A0A327QTJ5_9BACT|nr:glycosyltransferase involved in cell wall biosynthesis [Chitinophaga skermanii]
MQIAFTLPTTVPVFHNDTSSIPTTVKAMDLIVPCCNPPLRWVEQLVADYEAVQELMPDVRIQLIVVNDGSEKNFSISHRSQLKNAIPHVRIIHHPVNRGKGYAMRMGVAIAENEYQVCTDTDFPFGVNAIKEAFEQLQAGYDVVAGERGNQYVELLPSKRKWITRINRRMNQHVLRLKVQDAQAGLKAFNASGRKVFLSTRVEGFLYDSEFVHKAGKTKDLRIKSIPIKCRPGIHFSEFKSKTLWRELFNFIGILFR